MLKVMIPVLAGFAIAAMADGALAQGEGCLKRQQQTVSTQPTGMTPAPLPASATPGGRDS
jgi:hypothetical protein